MNWICHVLFLFEIVPIEQTVIPDSSLASLKETLVPAREIPEKIAILARWARRPDSKRPQPTQAIIIDNWPFQRESTGKGLDVQHIYGGQDEALRQQRP